MPKPKSGESKDEFISRCMGYDDMQKYDQDQRAAICYSYWDESKKESVEEEMTISPYVEEVSKVTGVDAKKLQPHWKKAKELTVEQFGMSEEEFEVKQFKHAQETLKELYGLKINRVDVKKFLESDLDVDKFLEQTVTSGDFPKLNKGTISKKDDDEEEEETGPGGHIPDGTGPHGRGEGPGKGKADGSGLEKKKEDIYKEKVTLDDEGHLLNMYGDELEEQDQGLYTIDCPKDIKVAGVEVEEGSPLIVQNEYEDVDDKYMVEIRIPHTNLSTVIRFNDKTQAKKYGWIK